MKTFRCWLCVVASSVILLGLMHLAEGAEPASDRYLVYVGTYTKGSDSEGIYRLLLDVPTGKMTKLGAIGGVVNPSFLAVSPSRKFLYAVSEIANMAVGGPPTGAVAAFAIDPNDGNLTPINVEASGGAGPCHLVVDPTEKCVLVANYAGGSVAALRIGPDGSLSQGSVVQHEGSSVNPMRQKEPHAHSINLDATGLRAYAPDLGIDKVLIYKVDPATAKLTANEPAFAAVDAGSGPRHFDFHPNGKFAYVINEIASTITAFAVDPKTGGLSAVQTVTTLPEGFSGKNSTADIHVHPNGKFVYGSNRGHDSIVVYAIDEATGKLTYVQHQSTLGQTPRNFGIDPSGRVLLAENQQSGTIHSFRIDQTTGKLTATGESVEVPRPVCVKFVAWGAR
jgi:6-phosphogluconolactonase